MDARLQRRIQRYGWDKAASAYEAGWRESLAPVQVKLLDLANARPGERVLDLACGTGLISLPLAEAVGSRGRVVATDISGEMIERVCHAAIASGLTQLTAVRADAEILDMVPEASVDMVTCSLGLMYVADPTKAMTEVLRVLKVGGRAVFSVWGERANCGWADIFPIVDAQVKSQVCPLFFRLGTGSTLAEEMTSVGFANVDSVRLDYKLPYKDDSAALVAAFAGGPVALAYDRFDAATRDATHRDYLASISRFRTPQGYRIPGEFVVCRGTKQV
ncbi:MAG: class I SAM-dependent methyltransferase [Methyloceanibacter sp.]|nr:class I SAM-dependent methyltransferase [Methyloceanibacter sp.]